MVRIDTGGGPGRPGGKRGGVVLDSCLIPVESRCVLGRCGAFLVAEHQNFQRVVLPAPVQ